MWIKTYNGSSSQTGAISSDQVVYLSAIGASSYGGTSGTWGVGAIIPGASAGVVESSSAFLVATELADEPTALAQIATILGEAQDTSTTTTSQSLVDGNA